MAVAWDCAPGPDGEIHAGGTRLRFLPGREGAFSVAVRAPSPAHHALVTLFWREGSLLRSVESEAPAPGRAWGVTTGEFAPGAARVEFIRISFFA